MDINIAQRVARNDTKAVKKPSPTPPTGAVGDRKQAQGYTFERFYKGLLTIIDFINHYVDV